MTTGSHVGTESDQMATIVVARLASLLQTGKAETFPKYAECRAEAEALGRPDLVALERSVRHRIVDMVDHPVATPAYLGVPAGATRVLAEIARRTREKDLYREALYWQWEVLLELLERYSGPDLERATQKGER